MHGGVTTASGDIANHNWKSLWRRRSSCGLAAEFLRFLYTVGLTPTVNHLAECKFTPNPQNTATHAPHNLQNAVTRMCHSSLKKITHVSRLYFTQQRPQKPLYLSRNFTARPAETGTDLDV
jgi:hypothetical protein